jgi:outer membrane protein assembly factor BamD (BamD/ComL family)
VGLNLTNKERPWTDTFGHAIRIYDRMRLDDPTGKLADDATIAAANALFTRGDFERADTYYSDLRMHFPSSEHQFMAHYLGIQSKIRAYRGPEFAGELLDDAEKLIKNARKQFPNEAREHQEELEKAYREVRYRKAEREWMMAEYYRQRREFGAARFYLDVVLDEYGDTPFADRAREQVEAITGKPLKPPQRLSWLVDLIPDGDIPEPRMANAAADSTTR